MAVTNDCCPNPHLWGQSVDAESVEEAERLAIKEAANAEADVHEIMNVGTFGDPTRIKRVVDGATVED